ncbi:MAG TPA: hypothetical protein PKK96_10740, partial [Anaerolineales bacterium]|nr:hypothetical protein [Anaerolineales bacterium]
KPVIRAPSDYTLYIIFDWLDFTPDSLKIGRGKLLQTWTISRDLLSKSREMVGLTEGSIDFIRNKPRVFFGDADER